MRNKKSVLKILSANSECFRVSAGIATNGRVYGKLGIKRADLFNLQQSKLKAQM